jgi:hypothetical protein
VLIEYCARPIGGVKMAIWVILIRVNLIIYPILCCGCQTDSIDSIPQARSFLL